MLKFMSIVLAVAVSYGAADAQAKCKSGDYATVISNQRYKFQSYKDSTVRNLPVGTQLRIITAKYFSASGMDTLTSIDVELVSAPKNMTDPQTGELLSCVVINPNPETGMFLLGDNAYFGMRFLSCM